MTQLVDSVYYRLNINENYKMKQNMQNQTISQLMIKKKTKYFSNPNDILNSPKSFCKKLYTKEITSKTATLFGAISNRMKISNKLFHHYEANNFLGKVPKSINCQTKSKSPGNDRLTGTFYKHLSNELFSIL